MDSAADICGAVQFVLASRGRAAADDAFLRTYIGRHLNDLFLDLQFTPAEFEGMLAEYRAHYLSRKHCETRVYPWVAEALAKLGGRKSTATTKGTPTTRNVLEQFGLLQHFDHVQGTDGFPAKPEPEVLLRAMAGLGAKPEDCLFVGDSPADMEAGRRAGVKICGVRWGYGDQLEMAKWLPDYWVDDLRDLVG
jgi:HAD superfamily hydrolase (TIGR01509 family)